VQYPVKHLQREIKTPALTSLASEKYRTDFRKDFARLIHCPSYRRLQGKTQLFPAHESDFFRNRLTHSHEVAQIAKSIAIRLNNTEKFLKTKTAQLDLDLVEFAGLAHDLGHPPFGHNGEHILDQLMLNHGGYEGNAQTLRIISRLEKKVSEDFPKRNLAKQIGPQIEKDKRYGLNLTLRTLASIIKYDNIIPSTLELRKNNKCEDHPVKGIYHTEKDLLNRIKNVIENDNMKNFKTVECSIMDIADDIAYSTYDLEDAFKANFLTPLSMVAMPDSFKARIAQKVSDKIKQYYPDMSEAEKAFGISDVNEILLKRFKGLFNFEPETYKFFEEEVELDQAAFILSGNVAAHSSELCRSGYLRTAFTSELVGSHIQSVEFLPNASYPSQSIARLKLNAFKEVETFKNYSFELLIETPRLRMTERRGKNILDKIFAELVDNSGLMPDDWQNLYKSNENEQWRKRVVCDFMAGMTDRYCVEIYSRLTSENPISIWKNH
jgi:dGTPase